MTEEWKRWIPHPNITGSHYIEEICGSKNDLTLKLCNVEGSKQLVRLIFKGVVLGYQSIDEFYCCRILPDLGRRYGSDFYVRWPFFEIINSSYLPWVTDRSGFADNTKSLRHFVIYTGDDVIDIVASSEPEVKFISGERL